MSHDPCCPLDGPALDCAVCAAIGAARSQEKNIYNECWRVNLPLISRRNYEQGYADGAAGRRKPRRFQ